jgi:tRNA U34 2-thiouridine synthase MnmA/TrmU
MKSNLKVLLLFSGGLDSILAYKILENEGYKIKSIQFYTPFQHISDKKEYVANFYENYNISLELIDIWDEYEKILLSPEYGFGKNLNPCIDCKLLFYRKAGEIMEKFSYDFLATGEVVGQRPFSQRSDAINFLEKKSGLKGKVLRPLSSGLSANVKEKNFYNIKGRGRKQQLEIA